MPELKKITSLSQQAKIIYETSIKLTEVFAGDALIVSEEKLKKAVAKEQKPALAQGTASSPAVEPNS